VTREKRPGVEAVLAVPSVVVGPVTVVNHIADDGRVVAA
jgi:hypothetical protein